MPDEPVVTTPYVMSPGGFIEGVTMDPKPYAHTFRSDPVPHPDLAGRCSYCGLTEPEHEGLMTEVEALRASAKAHIQRKHDVAKAYAREQEGRTMPAFSWADPMTWLDDWTPDV